MKKIYLALTLVLAIIMSSCSSNSTSGSGGIITPGGGGGNTGNVTFNTSLVQDQGVIYFQFIPSTGVVLTKITASCPQAQISNEVINGDGTTVYSQSNPMLLNTTGVTIAQGQQWTFIIEGKVGSSSGAAYTTTVNYTVQ
ncbi:MAG TPA: hypothetical protein PK536_04890 [Ignavibacteria bacterium]|nr:hypothetical protein [Ignavibacteria bacterium]HRJ98195.1 hypothetical protein [Ignavibacteria bacterium]